MELSYRLQQIADLITQGNIVADIGTDHAYIPIKMVLEHKIPKAIAMDIGKGPLAIAKEHVKRYGLQDAITCRLSDGMQKLDTEEADTIVIAGMGGDLITRICEHDKMRFLGNKEFILQPQSEYYKVRKQMHSMGYAIVEERFFMDEGKYDVCIKAHPGKEKYDSMCEYVFGRYLLRQQNAILKEYILKRQHILNEIEMRMRNANKEKEKTMRKWQEITEEKNLIKEALTYF